MANEFGGAYGLTVLSPIRAGPAHGTSYANRIRAELAGWPTGSGSPLADVDATHMARLAVLDNVFYAGHPAEHDTLRSRYLVFCTNFNGDLPIYLEQLRKRAGDDVERVWRHCVGFPGTQDATAFRTYFERCQIDSAIYFADYPEATVTQVLRALDLQQGFVDLVARVQGLPAAELRQSVAAFAGAIDTRPTPRPGSTMGGAW